jgi:hypothetical protein
MPLDVRDNVRAEGLELQAARANVAERAVDELRRDAVAFVLGQHLRVGEQEHARFVAPVLENACEVALDPRLVARGLLRVPNDDIALHVSEGTRGRSGAVAGRRYDARLTPVTEQPLHRALGLTDREYERIQELLERAPNDFELAVFSLLWSEHCGYKHSAPLLRRLPSRGPRVLQGPGENAGVIDVGNGLAVAFKVESHNHPSAVEPFQGAATGVGGILRDIVAMGARPIALLDGLRFGAPDWHFRRAVAGIGHYGNCVGVPNVGGECAFDPAYSDNPLVNAMCVGILPADRVLSARATGVGNALVL